MSKRKEELLYKRELNAPSAVKQYHCVTLLKQGNVYTLELAFDDVVIATTLIDPSEILPPKLQASRP